MASYTPNYNLKKPATTDIIDIGDINGNMDIIDTTMKALDDHIANFVQKTRNINTSVTTTVLLRIVDSSEDASLSGYVPIRASIETSSTNDASALIVSEPTYNTNASAWQLNVLNTVSGGSVTLTKIVSIWAKIPS